jgi:ethylbenzene dioxygenase beta subunit
MGAGLNTTLSAELNAAVGNNDITRERIESFLYLEARLLDERSFEAWDDLYLEEGEYWAPSNPAQTDPLAEVSIFYDDAELRRNRIRRLRHPEIHIQTPPSRTVRSIANVRFAQGETPSQWIVWSNLIVLEYRKGLQRTFGALVRHVLELRDGQFRIYRKRVDLINADDAFEVLTIPF